MTPSTGFTELFAQAPSSGALQWRASGLTLSSPCKERVFSFQLIAAFPLTYTGAASNPSMSFKTSYSSAEAASQQIGRPCPCEIPHPGRPTPTTHWTIPPLIAQPPSRFLFLHIATVIGNWNRKIRQKKLKHHLGWSWKRCRSRYLHLYSRGCVRWEASCGITGDWCSASRETLMSVPAPARSPQSLFPHPQASHTAVKLQNRVSKRSPRQIKQKENEAFLRFMQKVYYGATYTT